MIKNLCKCGHMNKMHICFSNGVAISRDGNVCIGYKIDSKCNCKEYVPSNNLEYIEWMYDKILHKLS